MIEYQEELFERYLMGHLSDQEKEEFVARINEDPKLSEAFEIHQRAYFTINYNETVKTKNKLQLWNLEATGTRGERRFLSPVTYAVAASVVLLIGFFLFYGPQSSQFSIDAHYSTMPNIIEEVSRNENPSKSELGTAMKLYDEKDFVQAELALEKFLQEHPDHTAVELYVGICKFENGKFEEAELILHKISKFETSKFTLAAEWYVTFALLSQGKKDQAKENLKQIIEQQGIYERQAINLLKDWK